MHAIILVFFGWKKRLRVLGLGYKIYLFDGILLFKFGYSHYVLCIISYVLQIGLLGRKKCSIYLFSLNKYVLNNFVRTVLLLKLSNIYTGKGIRMQGILFLRKEGKKSQF